ncbi:AraC family transcriptional regulator [Paratractidigestivibacter sp.]|uniref:AraC family transcriptional regulator n=1 Tax=Paratractidigestivibacter sp. TaxID=2847316 RepID=UPI002ABD59AA|nr:AraC family transcriptional regulator [Paratractidigestivibacter sp.]
MEIEELNRTLSKLSDSEREYRDGATFDWSRYGDEVVAVVNGRQVMQLKGWSFANWSSAVGTGRGRAPIALDNELYIRRHSRFNPMPEHVHSYVEMSYVYRGSCPQVVNGEEVLLRENQVLLLDSNCPHAIGSLGEQDIMVSICLQPSLLRRCLEETREGDDWLGDFLISSLNERSDHNRYVRFHSQRNNRVRRIFQELLCEYLEPSSHADKIILRLFQLLIAELMNVYESDYVRREQESSAAGVSVVSVVRYIQEHFLTCTLEGVAERFFVSPNYLSALLKKKTGRTYLQLVQDQKLAHAADLLATGSATVEDAAHAVGYENMSFFYRKFRSAYGCPPAEWRRRASGRAQVGDRL